MFTPGEGLILCGNTGGEPVLITPGAEYGMAVSGIGGMYGHGDLYW